MLFWNYSVRKMTLIVAIVATCGVLLGGCGAGSSGGDNSFTFKATVKATYGGRPVSGSAVLKKSLNSGTRSYPRGEAIAIELGGNKRVYMLLVDQRRENFLGGAIQEAFKSTYNPNDAVIAYRERMKLIGNLPVGTQGKFDHGKRKWPNGYKLTMRPLLVSFSNETDPASVFQVETEKPVNLFGQIFRFEHLVMERVESATPLTNSLQNLLPWVDPEHQYWVEMNDSGKIGHRLEGITASTLATETSFAQKMSRRYFYKPY